MGQAKLWAFHAEADSPAELVTIMKGGLAKLEGAGGSTAAPTPAKDAPAGKGKAAKDAPAKTAAADKATLPQVMEALTALKSALDTAEGGEKPKKGIKAVKAVLEKFGVTNSKDLTEDQYAPVIAAAKEATPEEEEAGDGESF